MADEQVVMSKNQFETFIKTMATELRKPPHDEIKAQQQKRMKEHNRAMQKDNREMLLNRFRSCNHMQLPGSIMTGCAAIAWATQSDGKVRGTCQHCGTFFSPVKEECLHEEIWEAYKFLIRIPTHPAGNVNMTFQHA